MTEKQIWLYDNNLKHLLDYLEHFYILLFLSSLQLSEPPSILWCPPD